MNKECISSNFVPKGTLTPLISSGDGGGVALTIPAWTHHGIFNGDGKDDGVDCKKRKRSANNNSDEHHAPSNQFEQLVSEEIRQCDVCARAIVCTPTLQQQRLAKNNGNKSPTSADSASTLPHQSIAESLPEFIERHIYSSSPIPCSFCAANANIEEKKQWCGSLYCSKDCQMMGEKAILDSNNSNRTLVQSIVHPKLFFCQNRVASGSHANEKNDLVHEIKESLSTIEKRFISVCGYQPSTIQTVGSEECALLLITIIACSCPGLILDIPNEKCVSNDIDSNEESLVEELWALSRAHRSLYEEVIQSNTQTDSQSIAASAFPSYQEFLQLYLFIKRFCVFRVGSPTHPLVAYATQTIISPQALSDEERGLAMDLLDTSKPSKLDNTDNKDEIQSTILRWRHAAHLAHEVSTSATDGPHVSKEIRAHLQKSYFVFSPSMFLQLTHSCAPTMVLTIPYNDQQSPLHSLLWLALHDTLASEGSISKLDSLEEDANTRAIELKRLMGREFVCKCIRCRLEAASSDNLLCLEKSTESKDSNINIFTRNELKSLADLAMQQGRYEDASRLYNSILKAHPNDGEILHSRAASYLGRASSVSFASIGHCQGHFLEAQRLWKEAGSIQECASHPEIATQIEKQRVYKTLAYILDGKDDDKTTVNIAFASYFNGKCFLTNEPILSSKECQRVIDTAEQYAMRKEGGSGWTTTRHYAVPTTDIPLHELADLQVWFYKLWKDKIRPLLRHQFQLTNSDNDRAAETHRDVFLHDAFVVRYDAMKQRYLPPHIDESSHSFILALNSDFSGGGTYIHELGMTLKPEVGGMLSFSGGEVLHSGDPVVEGVRYIIAAFCYVDIISEEKHKLQDIFADNDKSGKSTQDENQSLFSFGFNI